jgi:hypothetical protein
LEEKERVTRPLPEPQDATPDIGESDELPEDSSPQFDPRQLPSLIRKFARLGSKKERAAMEKSIPAIQSLLAYLDHEEEINAALEAIRPYQAEFEKILCDHDAYIELAENLFDEERFRPYYFTSADIQRAFDKHGYPSPDLLQDADEDADDTILKSLLFLADKDWRPKMSLELLLVMTEYVKGNRMMEAWMLHHCSIVTGEDPTQSNAFIFFMFMHGYDAWQKETRKRGLSMIKELGLDPDQLAKMSPPELEAWLAEQNSNPELKARMAAMMEANPVQAAMSRATLIKQEMESHHLLDRPDAAHLFLSQAEVETWIPVIMEATAGFLEQHPPKNGDAPAPKAEQDDFAKIMLPLLRQMTQGVFKPERIRQVLVQLREYRLTLLERGEMQAAALAMGAITYLEREDEPEKNTFLITLTYASFTHWARLMSGYTPEVTCDEESPVPPGEEPPKAQ